MSESSKLHMIDYKIFFKKSKVMAIWYVDLHQDVYKFYVNPLLYRSTTYPSVTVKIYSPFYLHRKVYLIIEFYSNTLISICTNISWKNFNIYQLKVMLNVWAM